MTKIFRKHYIMVLVQEQQGIFSILKKRRFNPVSPKVSYKKHAYTVDVNTPSYSIGLNFFYFVDINKGQLTFYQDIESESNSEIVDMILYKKIISQLTSNLSGDAYKLNIITLIIGAVMGGLLGYIIGGSM